mmetsp:Transcript_24933/g.36776  ORF Transcript_24933/g.36776 Transcript_24933/m.36776 type:complete len:259 (-) Transcript_24933:171-947(-)
MSELEQFCILARTLKGRACVALIQQVLSHSSIYVFGELLSVPSIQALRGSENANALETLELFAYGTFQQYCASPGRYIELTQGQIHRLKKLSLVSIAAKQKVVFYSDLQESLQIPDTQELEALVIECIYGGLLTGKLDQKQQTLHVVSCAARDVQADELDGIIEKLLAWKSTCRALIDNTQGIVTNLASTRAVGVSEQESLQTKFNEIIKKKMSEGGDEDFPALNPVVHSQGRLKGKRSRGTMSQPTGPSKGRYGSML